MALAFSGASANASLEALLRDQVPRADALNRNIHADDEMFAGAMEAALGLPGMGVAGYFKAGHQLQQAVRQIVTWRLGGFDGVAAMLDFACGYGRLSRFLVLELPPDRLWASDIYREGVAFVQDQLGAHGIVSVTDPDDYRCDVRFDCIVVPSLFSHLPARTFTRWLHRLYALLTPRGVLAFSVQDASLLPKDVAMPVSGILFAAASESRTLSTTDYGVTFVTEPFVARTIEDATGSTAYRRLPRAFGHSQDVYVVVPDGEGALSSLDFRFGPQGFLDHCALMSKTELSIGGWAVDPSPDADIAEIQVQVNGEVVQRGLPFEARPDVAAHLGSEQFLHAGYRCTCRASGGFRAGTDVLLVKAVSTDGTQYVLHCSTIREAITFLKRHPEVEREKARKAELHVRYGPALAERQGLARLPLLLGYHCGLASIQWERAGFRGLAGGGLRFLSRRARRLRARLTSARS